MGSLLYTAEKHQVPADLATNDENRAVEVSLAAALTATMPSRLLGEFVHGPVTRLCVVPVSQA